MPTCSTWKMQMRCTFSNLSPELIQKIASCLHPNDVAGALKLVNSETAAALGRYNKLVLGQKLEGNPIVYTGEPHRAELPWPGHAFVAHWGHHGPWRALSLRERRRLLCLAAASGHAASLGAALDHHGGALTPEVLVAAAAAGSLACCGRLLCEGCSVTFEAFRAAGQAGSVPVLQLLLQHIVYSPLSRRKAVVTAARGACAGGQAAALTWLQQACGHCIDEHDAIEAAQAGQAGLLELILPLLPEHMQHYGDAEPDLRRSRLLGAIAEGCTVEQLRRHYHPHLRRPRAERQAVRAATTEAPLIAPSATAAAAAGGAAAGAAAGEAAAAGGATGAPAAVPSPAPGGCDNALGGAALRRAPHVGASADTAGAAARPPEQWAMQASRAGDGAIDPWGEGASEEEGGEEHRSRGSHTDTDTDTDTAEEILEMMSQQSRELLSRLFNGAAASPTDCWRAKLDFLRNAWGPRRTRAAVIADDTECDVVRSATCGRPDFLQRLRYLHTELGVARGRTCAQFAAVGAAADALAYVWDECGVDMAHLRVQAPSALDEDTLDDLFFGANLDYSLMPVLRLLHERRVDLRARAAQLLDKAAPEAAACGDWDTADWLVEVVLAGVEVAGAEVEVETEVETEVVLASAEAEVEARPEREAAARRARWSRVFAAAAKAGARLAVLQGLAERGAAVDLAAVAQGGGEEALEWAAARLEAEAGAGALAQVRPVLLSVVWCVRLWFCARLPVAVEVAPHPAPRIACASNAWPRACCLLLSLHFGIISSVDSQLIKLITCGVLRPHLISSPAGRVTQRGACHLRGLRQRRHPGLAGCLRPPAAARHLAAQPARAVRGAAGRHLLAPAAVGAAAAAAGAGAGAAATAGSAAAGAAAAGAAAAGAAAAGAGSAVAEG